MQPSTICRSFLGGPQLEAVVDLLSSPQLKAVLREAKIKVDKRGGYVSIKKKRRDAAAKITAAIEADDDEAAGELLQQWLLNHRRQMLIAYLDLLQVKHSAGETDQTFLISCPAESVRAAALRLVDQFPRHEVQAYLHYIAYQQKSSVFDQWEPLAG